MLMLRDTWYRRCLRNILPWSLCHAIEQAVIDPLKMLNVRAFQYPAMDPQTRARLVRYFAPHNEVLSKLIRRDLAHWRK